MGKLFFFLSRFLYPGIVTLLVASVSFPLGLGQFIAGDLTTHEQVTALFINFTWTKPNHTVEEMNILQHWSTPHTDVFIGLFGFIAFTVVINQDCDSFIKSIGKMLILFDFPSKLFFPII